MHGEGGGKCCTTSLQRQVQRNEDNLPLHIRAYLKENLKVEVRKERTGGGASIKGVCFEQDLAIVSLVLDGEVISEDSITL